MLTRYAAPVLGPNMLAALRMGFAAIALAAIMRALGQRWPMEHWRELTLLAVLSVAGPHLLLSWAALYMPAGYAALPERAYLIDVLGFDWNCPQHITPRFTETEVRQRGLFLPFTGE